MNSGTEIGNLVKDLAEKLEHKHPAAFRAARSALVEIIRHADRQQWLIEQLALREPVYVNLTAAPFRLDLPKN